MKLLLYFFLLIVLLSGCLFSENANDENQSDDVLHVQDEVKQDPLSLRYQGFKQTDDAMTLGFTAEHQDESSIVADDYHFNWPSFITDENELHYELTATNVNSDHLFSEELEDHQLGVTFEIAPPPVKGNSSYFIIPFDTIPKLFEDGYQFTIDDDTENAEIGDIAVYNISTENQQISFLFEDDHPDADRQQEYLFTIIEDETNIYPLFSRVEKLNGARQAEVEFADDLDFPLQFSIDRTSADISEWRFTFVIEIAKGEDYSS